MAKWINTATGEVVPASEVRELTPGSGIFVHEATVNVGTVTVTPYDTARVGTPPPGTIGNRTFTANEPGPRKVVDGFAIKIADDATYDPAVDTVAAQVLASQAALRAREAGR